ncbi:MAG: hypothetical protein KDC38_06720 [Planctomycetes bacterium]|nr:hypothetical protein [Planctomycetota bacterium]
MSGLGRCRGGRLEAVLLSVAVSTGLFLGSPVGAQVVGPYQQYYLPVPVVKFDFQPRTATLAAGYRKVGPNRAYTAQNGYGFTVLPTGSTDGTGHTWEFQNQTYHVDEILPPSVNDAATIDCVTSDQPFTFRVDVPAGDYNVRLWLGDVTTPRHQVHATINGIDREVERMDINNRRGSFDQTIFGNAVPVTVYDVDASQGYIEVTIEKTATGDQPITWTYWQDEDPTQPPYQTTATLVPAFSQAGLQAIEVHPAAEPPLVGSAFGIIEGSAASTPQLTNAITLFNNGDILGALDAFNALSDPYARASGQFWCAGHPAIYEDERVILADVISTLEGLVASNPQDWVASDLLHQARLAEEAEYLRSLFGYEAAGLDAATHLGRSCSLVENFDSFHPYMTKGEILWFRNRGGLDPRRVTVSWEIAQFEAQRLDIWWGVSPFVTLYSTDQWVNDGSPWALTDWGALAGPGPNWARDLMSALNNWIDLLEWWAIHRQSPDGDIGGGWTDDVEIVPAFGIMAYVLNGASNVLEYGMGAFTDGIWNSGVIDTAKGYQQAYADVEHSAEPTGNLLHLDMMIRYGNPEGIERILKSAKTFRDLFQETSGSGAAHFKGNHMSSTQIATNPNHRVDIPLCGRATNPFPWLVWYSENPGVEVPLENWITEWVADALRAENDKPYGIFPNSVWVPTDGIGTTGNSWWNGQPGDPYGVFTPFPQYQSYLLNLAGYFYLRNGDPNFLVPFEKLRDYKMAWHNAGAITPPAAPPAGMHDLWAGAKLPAAGYLTNLVLKTGSTAFDTVIGLYGDTYGRFLLNPTDPTPIADLAPNSAELVAKWPYKTTEGVMTDRILLPGWADVVSYYFGAEVFSAFFGMPVHHVTWENASRFFAAAVTDAGDRKLSVSTYLFEDNPRTIIAKLWGLETGRDYRVQAGPANDLGLDPTSLDHDFVYHLDERGQGPSITIPGRAVYAIRITDENPSAPSDPQAWADLAVAPEDISYDDLSQMLHVRVHNIGSQASGTCRVAFFEGSTPTGTPNGLTLISSIAAPIDLDAKFVDLSFPYIPTTLPGQVAVWVDTNGAVAEITEMNNQAVATIGGTAASFPPPMIAELVPNTLSAGGTAAVEGKNFDPAVLLLEGDVPSTHFTLTWIDGSHLTVTANGGAVAATYFLSLRNPDGKESNVVSVTVQ